MCTYTFAGILLEKERHLSNCPNFRCLERVDLGCNLFFCFFFRFIIIKKSSAYALKLICLCRVIMFASLLKAIINKTTDIGEP